MIGGATKGSSPEADQFQVILEMEDSARENPEDIRSDDGQRLVPLRELEKHAWSREKGAAEVLSPISFLKICVICVICG